MYNKLASNNLTDNSDCKNLRIHDISENERPRERLLKNSPESLSNSELLAIVISTGTKDQSALVLANKVLSLVDGEISLFSSFKTEEFSQIKGIGPAISCKIAAAIELGKRINSSTITKYKIESPADIANLCNDMKHLQKEVFRVLLFNVKHECIGKENISIGSVNSSYAEPREVFSEAIRRGAFAIALVHNHPSGDSTPSITDIDTTKQLVECGKMLGIRVLDHVIIGSDNFYSFKNEGIIV